MELEPGIVIETRFRIGRRISPRTFSLQRQKHTVCKQHMFLKISSPDSQSCTIWGQQGWKRVKKRLPPRRSIGNPQDYTLIHTKLAILTAVPANISSPICLLFLNWWPCRFSPNSLVLFKSFTKCRPGI